MKGMKSYTSKQGKGGGRPTGPVQTQMGNVYTTKAKKGGGGKGDGVAKMPGKEVGYVDPMTVAK